jgi:hypothetical protein
LPLLVVPANEFNSAVLFYRSRRKARYAAASTTRSPRRRR